MADPPKRRCTSERVIVGDIKVSSVTKSISLEGDEWYRAIFIITLSNKNDVVSIQKKRIGRIEITIQL